MIADSTQSADVTKKAAATVCPAASNSAARTGESPKPAITAIESNVKKRTLNSSATSSVSTIGQSA